MAGIWFIWFIWSVWFVWFVWFRERNKLDKPDRPNKLDRLPLNRPPLTLDSYKTVVVAWRCRVRMLHDDEGIDQADPEKVESLRVFT